VVLLVPDAAWFTGTPTGMRFLEEAHAAEVRSEGDYGPLAERRIAEKRRDYFAAGTLCVWDVDILGRDIIKSYHSNDPDTPIVFRRGDLADAGDAVPGGPSLWMIYYLTRNGLRENVEN